MAREVCESYLCAKYYSRALAGVHCTRVDTEEQEEEDDDEETTRTRTFYVKGGGKLPPIWVKGNKSPTWTNENVTIPKATDSHVVSQMFGRLNLLMEYNILSCLPVSSVSDERVMSKLKIVKNRLRPSLSYDTYSALLILASEKRLTDATFHRGHHHSIYLCYPFSKN